MKVAFVADCHVGNHKRHGGAVESGMNARCRAALAVLSRASVRSRELGCDSLVVLGDLFDTAAPSPQVIAAVQRTLGGEAYLLLGNHDMVSAAAGDHALGPLDGFNLIEVVSRPGVLRTGGADLWMVPFQPGDAREWLPRTLAMQFQNAQGRCGPRVLCLHLGLIDDSTPPYLTGAHDAVPVSLVEELCANYGIDFVVAGNWHARKRWGNILQVGALVPTGWDNPGLEGYGTLAILDAEAGTLTYEELPGPRFVKSRTVEESRTAAAEAGGLGHQLYLQHVAAPDQLDSTRQALGELTHVAAFEVVPDAAQSERSARLAAESARAGDTLVAALSNYVAEMGLDEGVDRAAVLRRARGYLWVDSALAALKETE